MHDEDKREEKDCCTPKKWHKAKNGGMFGGFYFLGFLGAAIFYIQQADSFGMGFLGFLKAVVWPAFLVYEALVVLVG